MINPTCRDPDITAWSNTVRLMRQIDNRSHQDICGMYDWASKDSFWHRNILSPDALRKQWDKLTMQRCAPGVQVAGKPKVDLNNTGYLMQWNWSIWFTSTAGPAGNTRMLSPIRGQSTTSRR